MNVLPVANHMTEPDNNSQVCKEEGGSSGDAFTSVLFEANSAVSGEKSIETNAQESGVHTDRPAKDNLLSNIALYVPVPVHILTIRPEVELIVTDSIQDPAALSPIISNDVNIQPGRPANELPEYINGEGTRTTGFAPELTEEFRKETDQSYIPKKENEAVFDTVGTKNTTETKSTIISHNKVISILESDKETVSQSENPDIFSDIPVDEKQMARMPQENIIKGAEDRHNPDIISDAGNSEDTCPLENENDVKPEAAPPAANVKAGNLKDKAGEEDVTGINLRSVEGQQTLDISPEKFIAEQEFGMAAKETPSIDNLFDVMVEKIEFLRTDSSDKMEVRLKPEHLGKVTIELASSDDGLKVRIRADNAEVKALIGGQINQLLETLNEKGIRVSAVNVVYSGIADQSSEQPGNGREKKHKSSRILTGIDGIEPAGGIEQSEIPVLIWDKYDTHGMETTISSVEYRA